MLIAHGGHLHPEDLWTTWTFDPLVIVGLAALAWIYWRGRRPDRRRDLAFVAAMVLLVVALISPLEALADSLASAHMAQHIFLILGAAPLLAASGLGSAVYRAGGRRIRRATRPWRRRIRRRLVDVVYRPGFAVTAHIVAIWVWHARIPYDGAASNDAVHLFQHLSFLGTGYLFWRVISRPGRERQFVRVIALFVMSLQGAFLSALLTFAEAPWYQAYLESAPLFGLTPLADQQIGGLIMWVPSGLVYIGSAVAAVIGSLRTEPRILAH